MECTTNFSEAEPIVITIGNFDGIHRGHQRLMHELAAMASALHCQPVMVTFEPHTLLVVRPNLDVHYLTTLEEKVALARRYGGIKDSIVIHFTPEVSAISASEFLDDLRRRYTIKGMVVGENFSMGHNRMGDTNFLEQYGREHGIDVRVVPLQEAEEIRISSTRIRKLVGEGQVAEANELLGHPVTLCDVVRHGNKRGRLLGYPTANMLPEAHKLLPSNGIYAARVHLTDILVRDDEYASSVYKGAVSIGIRPTFDETERIVEVYLLDIQPDLYDQRITVEFIARLRDEERFDSIEALKAQMARDVEQARQLLTTGG
jgi:riboflavin kinase/FMN adenylyltransferase